MNRRRFLYALPGLAATLRASGRAGAEPFMNASVAVGYDQPGRAISKNFIGLSYESAVLASAEYLSAGNLSIIDFLRGLGPGGVLRLGGNSSERTVWRLEVVQNDLESAKQAADKAKTEASDLKKQVTILNSELDKANAQGNELQTKFDQASSELKGLKSELQQVNAERDELQTELNQAKSEVQPAQSGNAPSEPRQ